MKVREFLTAIVIVFALSPLFAQEQPMISVTADRAIARGKWSGKGVEEELPARHAVAVQCDRAAQRCVEAVATVVPSKDPYIAIVIYEIAEWNENYIVAKDESAVCASKWITIDSRRNGAVVTMSTSRKPGAENNVACNSIDESTRTYKLIAAHPF